MEKEYDVMKIKGKHGIINLHIPKEKPSKEDYDRLYDVVAGIIISSNKTKNE